MSSPTKSRGRLTVAILVQVLAIAFQTYAILTAMPAAAAELGGLALYAWGFTAFTVAMLFATVVAGRMCDKSGPRLPIALGIAVFVVGLTLAGFAPNMPFLLVTRAIQGFGAGALAVCLMVLLAEVYSETERPRIMTAFSFCWVIPSFAGPPLAAWIVDIAGWQWVFWATLIPILFAFLLGLEPLIALGGAPRAEAEDHSASPIWAAGLAALGVATLQLAGQRLTAEAGRPLPNTWVTGLIATLALAMLVVGIPRLMPPGFARWAKGLPAVMTERAWQTGAFAAAESFLPLLLVTMHGFTLFQAGIVLTLGSLGWTLGSWLQARPWFPLSRNSIVILGASIGVIGAGTLIWGAALPGASWLWIAVGNAINGLGMGFAVASTSLVMLRLSEPGQVGKNSASLAVAEALGNSLTTAVTGTVFVIFLGSGVHLRFAALLVVPALAALAAVAAARRIGHIPNELH